MRKRITESVLAAVSVISMGFGVAQDSREFKFLSIASLCGSLLVIKTKIEGQKEIDQRDRENQYELQQRLSETQQAQQQLSKISQATKYSEQQQLEKIKSLEKNLVGSQELLKQKLSEIESLETLLNDSQHLMEVNSPVRELTELVKGRTESRQKLIEFLEIAQEELILVCPWLCDAAIDSTVQKLISDALRRGVTIQIGYGFPKDLKNFAGCIDTRSNTVINLPEKERWRYSSLSWLNSEARKYPSLLTLKFIGTHEKYLICDCKYLLIGSHNFLTSPNTPNFSNTPEPKELSILLQDPIVIREARLQFFETKPLMSRSSTGTPRPIPKKK